MIWRLLTSVWSLHVNVCSSNSSNFKHGIETSSFHQNFSRTPRNVTSNWFRHYPNFRFRAPLTLSHVALTKCNAVSWLIANKADRSSRPIHCLDIYSSSIIIYARYGRFPRYTIDMFVVLTRIAHKQAWVIPQYFPVAVPIGDEELHPLPYPSFREILHLTWERYFRLTNHTVKLVMFSVFGVWITFPDSHHYILLLLVPRTIYKPEPVAWSVWWTYSIFYNSNTFQLIK